ncbi:hypothetical protein AAKU52_003490 [Pedobacter sp. CG_S7]|uniref:hypothetical protein n=1 Tax=Pedobacter sp. CG_S7 TaxID=3143930 RepID=UPI00339A75F6
MFKKINVASKFFGLTLILLLSTLFHSCKKDSQSEMPTVESQDFVKIKQWFSSTYAHTSSNPFKTMSPNWGSTFVNEDSVNRIYEIRLLNPDNVFIGGTTADKDNLNALVNRSDIRLLIFENKETGTIKNGCYMAVVSENGPINLMDVHYKEPKSLDGKILYYHLNGSFSNGNYYSKGNVEKRVSLSKVQHPTDLKASKIMSSKNKINKNQPITIAGNADRDCWSDYIAIYKYTCIGVNGDYECSQEISGYNYVEICYGGGNDAGGYPPGEGNGEYEGGNGGSTHSKYINNFVMDLATQAKYPKFTQMVKILKDYVRDDKDVMDALLKWTGFSESQILELLEFEQGPQIVIKELVPGEFGYFNRTENPNIINISASWARGLESANLLETRQGTAFMLAVTVLHEFVHFSRAENGLDRDYEYGYGFEESAYGLIIKRNNANENSYLFYKK